MMVPAQFATAEAINFLVTHARGLVCLPLDSAIVDKLQLTLQPQSNRRRLTTLFTISIEARRAITTGISAQDRSNTVAAAIDPQTGPQDLATPGHVFPVRIERDLPQKPGDLHRLAVDICDVADLRHAAVTCEILAPSGDVPSQEWIVKMAADLNLPVFDCCNLDVTSDLKCHADQPIPAAP